MKFRSAFLKQHLKVIIWFRSVLGSVPVDMYYIWAVIFLVVQRYQQGNDEGANPREGHGSEKT